MRTTSPRRSLAVGLLVAASCAAAIVANVAPSGPADEVVAAVYAPWRDPADAFTRAASAAPVVGVGAAPFILLSRAPTPSERTALRRSGAWLILDGSLARWCGAAPGGSDVA